MLESSPRIGSDLGGVSWNFFLIQSLTSCAPFLAAGLADIPCGGGVADDEGDVFCSLLESDSEGSSLEFFGREGDVLDSYSWEGSAPEDDAAPCVLICICIELRSQLSRQIRLKLML